MFNRFAMADLTGGEMNALVKLAGGPDKVKRILRGELKLVVTDPATASTMTKARSSSSPKVLAGILELYGEPVKVPKHNRFVARDKFVIDRNGELPISWLGGNFRSNFLDVVEDGAKAAMLKQRKLLKRSVDGPILSALGGEEKATIALASAFEFLKTANRTKWFIFYIKDAKGIVWAVNAVWDGRGWYVGAIPVTNPRAWGGGNLVVSR